MTRADRSMHPTEQRNNSYHHMAGANLTSSRNSSPFPTALAPHTPTSVTSQPHFANTLAPIAAATSSYQAATSPRSQKALSPRYSPRPLTGAAALEDQRRLREQQDRASASSRTSPNPSAAAISHLLAQSLARSSMPPNAPQPHPSQQLAELAQKIEIPEGQHENMQTSPVSMSSLGSLEMTSAANASTTAAIMAPSMPVTAENPYPNSDPNAPRPAVDTGVPGDSRAFTFPPPPADDPRNNSHRNMSLPGPGMNSPRTQSAKRHKCPYCSTVFTRHHNLKSHLLTHSQEKPYECQQCQSRFRRLHDLKRHTKLHTGERPHECPKCGRKFARGDALARHNKGQGGCAGRRSSFGMEPEEGEIRPGDHMSGIEYTAEPDQMEEEQDMRRESESSHQRQESGSYRAAPSTYPPPAVGPQARGPGSIAPMYPPAGPASQRETNSPHPHPGSLSSAGHFPPAGPALYQGGVTESPKPISPGPPPNSHRASTSGPANHAYSYNSRGSGPQLPPLPPMQHGNSMPPPGSQPGSLSSGGGSMGSTRDILGPRDNSSWQTYEADQRMNKMQEDHLANLARMQSDRTRTEAALNQRISDLEAENKALKDNFATHEMQLQRVLDELASARGRQAE